MSKYKTTTGKSKVVNNRKYQQLGDGGVLDAVTSGISALGGIEGNLLKGDLESPIGSTISSLSGLAGAIPGPWGAVAGAGLKVLGGLATRAFGSKINQGNIDILNNNTAAINNTMSNTSNFEALSNAISSAPTAMGFDNSFVGKDGWFANKAKNKAEELRAEQLAAIQRQDAAFLNNAEQLNRNQMDLLDANYSAFGGYLGSNGADFKGGLTHVNTGNSHESNPLGGVPMGAAKDGTQNLVEEGETIYNDYVFSNRLNVPEEFKSKYKLGRKGKQLTFAEASKKLSKEADERPNDPISKRGLKASLEELQGVQEELKAKNAFDKLSPLEKMGLMQMMQQQTMSQEANPQMTPQEQPQQFSTGGNLNIPGMEDMPEDIMFDADGNLRPYGHQGKTYNLGWFGEDGKYTKEYLDAVNNLSLAQFQAQIDDQYNYFNNEANKGTQRWSSIKQFYDKNKEYGVAGYKATENDLAIAKKLAQDGKPGFMHYLIYSAIKRPITPEMNPSAVSRDALTRHWLTGQVDANGTPLPDKLIENYDPNSKLYNYLKTTNSSKDNTDYTDHFYNMLTQKEPPAKVEVGKTPEFKKMPTWMRFAPTVGLGVSTLTDVLRLTNKPDYSTSDAVLNAARDAGTYMPVSFNPIGNKLGYTPFDREFYINQLNAQSGATRRAILDNAGLNRGAGMASLLAADYNALGQLGNLARQAEEYNIAQQRQVEEFNRQTNTANSEGFLRADSANQSALANSRGTNFNAVLQGLQMKDRANQIADQNRSLNVTNFLESIGNIGRENMQWNWRNHGLTAGIFGAQNEDLLKLLDNAFVKAADDKNKPAEEKKGENK